jgi:hypothetical protein
MRDVGGDCHVFEVDGKAFEAHVTQRDLVREHSVYKAAFPGDEALAKLLEKQLSLRGVTAHGIEFFREGCRASGDLNTGMGNSLIMLAAVIAAFMVLTDTLGVEPRYTALADGDNCLVFVEDKYASFVHENFSWAVSTVSSQELAVESMVTRFEDVVFGQCKPVCLGGDQVTMVRDPLKVLSGAFCGYRHYGHMRFGRKVLKAVSQCELALAKGVPVLQAYFGKAVDELQTTPDLQTPEDFLEGNLSAAVRFQGLKIGDARVVPVTMEARLSFEAAFGISVPMQLFLEEELPRKITFPDRWETISVRDGVDGFSSEEGDCDWLDGKF